MIISAEPGSRHHQGACRSGAPLAVGRLRHDGLFRAGAFHLASGTAADLGRIDNTFRTGVGIGWHEHKRSRPMSATPSASSNVVPEARP